MTDGQFYTWVWLGIIVSAIGLVLLINIALARF